MAILEIPVRNDLPAYNFTINLEGTVYLLRFRWNGRMERWFMDIADTSDNDILIGVPMLTGINLFKQFVSESLPPGSFLVYDETGNSNLPTRDNFGEDVVLLYKEASV